MASFIHFFLHSKIKNNMLNVIFFCLTMFFLSCLLFILDQDTHEHVVLLFVCKQQPQTAFHLFVSSSTIEKPRSVWSCLFHILDQSMIVAFKFEMACCSFICVQAKVETATNGFSFITKIEIWVWDGMLFSCSRVSLGRKSQFCHSQIENNMLNVILCPCFVCLCFSSNHDNTSLLTSCCNTICLQALESSDITEKFNSGSPTLLAWQAHFHSHHLLQSIWILLFAIPWTSWSRCCDFQERIHNSNKTKKLQSQPMSQEQWKRNTLPVNLQANDCTKTFGC